MRAIETRRPGLAVFDVEGVLIPKKRFLFFEVGRNLRFSQFLRIAFYGFLYEVGLVSLKVALSNVFKSFKGMRTEQFLRIFRRLPLMPKVEQVFEELRNEGWKTALISSGLPTFVVQDLASRLGADYAFGLELKTRSGALTGEIGGQVLEEKGKLPVLRSILATEELLPEDCVVVVDDRHNLSILLPGALKIGYNPDFAIRAKADTVISGQLPEILPLISGRLRHTVNAPTRNEALREAIHASGFLVPVIAGMIGVVPVALFIYLITLLYITSELARMERINLPFVARVTRYAATLPELYEFATAPMFFALGIFLTLVLFPPPVNAAAIASFALGDSTASLFGRTFGRNTMPFNRGKTVEGSVVCFFFAFLASVYFVPPAFALVASAAATIVESLPLPIDDNLATPLITGFVLFLLRGL
jgi:dolichol kinase/phosphoserine phosphatase